MQVLLALMATAASAQPASPAWPPALEGRQVWFARAGADGDGTSAASPVGSTAALEASTSPGDVIVLLLGEAPFEGGLALKPGQTLVGLADGDRRPAITNRDPERNGGVGVLLAAGVKVWNVRVEGTHASGMMGTNTDGVQIDGVEVVGANTSGSATSTVVRALGGAAPHGGIVLVATGAEASVRGYVSGSRVTDATGVGIASLATGGAAARLWVHDSRVAGVLPIGYAATGIAGVAEGPSSEVLVEVSDSDVGGRLRYEDRVVYEGRNVVALASADGTALLRVARSHVGPAGQDGVLGAAALVPARVDVEVVDSVVEGAGQSNVEGTILSLPPWDPSRADETRVSVRVSGTTLRGAGGTGAFDGQRTNVYLGSSPTAQQLDPTSTTPFPAGRYRLEIRDSRVEGAGDHGLSIGGDGSEVGIGPEGATFEVRLRDNEFLSNGSGEIALRAPRASVDALRNCWGTPDGLSDDRLVLGETARRSQVDAADPLRCDRPQPD